MNLNDESSVSLYELALQPALYERRRDRHPLLR